MSGPDLVPLLAERSAVSLFTLQTAIDSAADV